MKSLYKNFVKGGFLGAIVLLGATACSDDHFDVKNQPGYGGTQTLWQSIEVNPELTQAAEILKATRVMKDEDDKRATLTYAEWLNQPMEATVWLPKNGTFDNQKYLDMLQEAKDSLAAGNQKASLRIEFMVVNQFVRNHISLFSHSSVQTRKQIRLTNTKLCFFDPANSEFNGVKYDPAATVYCSNGALYTLEAASPFANNIFDFMSSDSKFSTIYGIISDPAVDKDVFWPEGSTEGAMNEKGEIVYVDSVFVNSNEILNSANALIKSEDSIYVAIIPTNEAWQETFDAVKPLYKFGNSYCYDWDETRFTQTGNNALKFTAKEIDSLTTLRTNTAIISNMFFNPTNFNGVDKLDSAQVINHMLYADSLISTSGVVYYNQNAGTGRPNPLFEGLTPIRASNGYVFAPTNNRIVPEYSFISRRITSPAYILASSTDINDGGQYVTLTPENWQKDSVVGTVENDTYMYYAMDGNSALKVRFRLSNLPSGRYKISAQMLPNRVNRFNVKYEDDGVTPIEESPLFDATIYGDDLKRIEGNRDLTVNQDSVQNVVLFENFNLEKTYTGLPDGYETFAILELSISASQKRKGKCDALSIAKIIIEPVRE